MRNPDGRILAVLLMAAWLTGCNKIHHVRVWNTGTTALSDVAVSYSGVRTSFGHLGPSLYAVKRFMRHSPTGTAEVSWTDSEGREFSVTLTLDMVPRRYADGMLSFRFDGEEKVTASFFFEKRP